MAAMSTALTVFSGVGNTRTSTLTGHTAFKPKILIEKRRVPEGNQVVGEYSFKVVEATTDANDVILSNKVSFEAIYRAPVNGNVAETNAALAVFRDVVASDDFANSVATQNWL